MKTAPPLSIYLCSLLCSYVVFVSGSANSDQTPAIPGLTVPAGFTITEFAGPELANDIYCLAISPEGQIVVSGRGYLKQLVDENGDGRADRAVLLADHPKDGAMGMLIEKDQFYFMGDGGVRRMPWRPGAFTDKSELLYKLKTGGEHDAHAISRGPDGWFYLLCGNDTGISAKHATNESSPISTPTAGCVLRVDSTFKHAEIIADGFRNAYGFDWSLGGELFTYDSDNERCLGLPWYVGTRFYRLERGGHYGWRTPQKGQFWRMPPYWPGVIAPLADLGRGSPTGVVCYRHQQFPREYHGAFFLLDWTFGVIHLAKVKGEQAETSTFVKAVSGNGFAPTGAAVLPQTGDLYVSSGGRGTRGAVYRIRHEAGFRGSAYKAGPLLLSGLERSKTLHLRAGEIGRETDPIDSLHSASSMKEELQALQRIVARGGEIGPKPFGTFAEGYAFRKSDLAAIEYRREALEAIGPRFPARHQALNREYSRALGLFRDDRPRTLTKLLEQITPESEPLDDVHYLFVLACCPAPRGETHRKAIVDALLHLEGKYEKRNLRRERNWSLRLGEAYRGLIDLDPELPQAILSHKSFGEPGHLIFTEDRRFPRRQGAELWLTIVKKDKDYPWSTSLVELLAELPGEQMGPLFRERWVEPGLREALLPFLVKAATERDREILITGLGMLQAKSVELALEGLQRLPTSEGKLLEKELLALVLARRRWKADQPKVAQKIEKRWHQLTGTEHGTKSEDWAGRLVQRYPQYQGVLNNPDGVDVAAWKKRLEKMDWNRSDHKRGQALFERHCAACHQGRSALGPDLAGVGRRMGHDDLLTTILQPSKDVSSRYRTTVVVTKSGQTHAGMVIYEAVDGVILQTDASTTMRIAGDQIAGQRISEQSLMPIGMLDRLSDQEIADLVGYLKTK